MTGADRERARMMAIRVAQSIMYAKAPLKVGNPRVKAARPARLNDPLGKRRLVSSRVIREKNWKAFRKVAERYAAQVARA